MRKLGIALSLLAALSLNLLGWAMPAFAQGGSAVGPPNIISCNKQAIPGTLTVGTTQVIAGVSGQIINLCGYVIEGLAAGTIQFVFGTGATCTTPTNVTPNFTTTATTSIVDHVPTAWISSAPGQSLCAVVTGTNPVTPAVYYATTP